MPRVAEARDTVRAITADDLSTLARLGLDQAITLRAIATQMGWLIERYGKPHAACAARFVEGAVFIDCLVGDREGQQLLIDHVVAYGRWSDAPAILLAETPATGPLVDKGFVGLAEDAFAILADIDNPSRLRLRRL
ncbi:MAG: hypothetical protein AAGH43_09830 [Pseudomonadota bacterium]